MRLKQDNTARWYWRDPVGGTSRAIEQLLVKLIVPIERDDGGVSRFDAPYDRAQNIASTFL